MVPSDTVSPQTWLARVFSPLIPIVVAVLLIWRSAFRPWGQHQYWGDNGVFAYVAWAWQQGRVPYTEAWDNKGPLLYALDRFGLALHGSTGIYALELLFAIVSAVIAWRIASLLSPSSVLAALSASVGLLPLYSTFEAGNLAEEWALPFCLCVCYVALSFFFAPDTIRHWQIVSVGICVGAITLLRANILTIPAVFLIGVILTLIMRHEFVQIVKWCLLAILGIIIIAGPFVVYLAFHKALTACWNAAYGGVFRWSTTFSAQIASIGTLAISFKPKILFVVIAITVCGWLLHALQRGIKSLFPIPAIVTAALILNLYSNALSAQPYLHYWTTFVPPTIIVTAIFLDWCVRGTHLASRWFNTKWLSRFIASALTVVMFASCVLVVSTKYTQLSSALFGVPNSNWETDIEFITSHSGPADTIQIFGYGGPNGDSPGLYFRTERLAASCYPYTPMSFWTLQAQQQIAIGIADDILARPPAILLGTPNDYTDFLNLLPEQVRNSMEALVDNNFKEVDVIGTGSVIAYIQRTE